MASIWKETFEASEFDNSWDFESVEAGCTSDGDSALPAVNPLLASTKCYKTITADAISAKAVFLYEDLAGDKPTMAFTGWLYIDAESLANGQNVVLYQISDSSLNLVYRLYLVQVAGVLYLTPFYWDGVLLQGTASVVTTGTWNLIQFYYSVTTAMYKFIHNFSSIQITKLAPPGLTRIPRKIYLGQFGNQGVTGCTVYWDACEWNDTDYPNPEGREPSSRTLIMNKIWAWGSRW